MSEGLGFPTEVIEAVRYIYASDAWVRYFAPSLESIKETWIQTLIDPSTKRKDEYSDEYLRGCIATVNAFLTLPQSLIDEADAQRARREAEQAQEDHFRSRADLGTH